MQQNKFVFLIFEHKIKDKGATRLQNYTGDVAEILPSPSV